MTTRCLCPSVLMPTSAITAAMLAAILVSGAMVARSTEREPRPDRPAASERGSSDADTTTQPGDDGPPREKVLVLLEATDEVSGGGDSEERTGAVEAHQAVLERARADGVVLAFGALDDGSWVVIMFDVGVGRTLDILRDSPLYTELRVRTAIFDLTVGELCETGGPAERGPLFFAAYERDPQFINRAVELAPQPFGTESKADGAVQAAAAWGYGHHGFVFIRAAELDEARSVAAALPGASSRQWSWTVRELDLRAGALCRKPPGEEPRAADSDPIPMDHEPGQPSV